MSAGVVLLPLFPKLELASVGATPVQCDTDGGSAHFVQFEQVIDIPLFTAIHEITNRSQLDGTFFYSAGITDPARIRNQDWRNFPDPTKGRHHVLDAKQACQCI